MDLLHTILGPDIQAGLLIILNLIVIETMLSVDNAAVLATMVMRLAPDDRARALRYGIILGYIFRGLCLVFAAWLINVWWLKPLGGAYLIYLAIHHFVQKANAETEEAVDTAEEVESSKFYKATIGALGPFWATVISVEIMDLAFSIDNVFAAVAFTDNIYLIWTGVFIGILAMRFVAQGFVRLMSYFPFMETVAFLVIGILGIKLTISLWGHFQPESAFAKILESETADLAVSLTTVGLFLVPLLTSWLFNWPHHSRSTAEGEAQPKA